MQRNEELETEEHASRGDDFKLIRPGIGPSVEGRLHKGGIHTFEQLAALSSDEVIARIGPMIGITADRVTSWGWQEQAKGLAKQRPPALAPDLLTEAGESQHYATFTIQLLLDADDTVRRTRVKHIQSGEEVTWASWEDRPVVEFLVQRAGVRLPLAGSPVEPSLMEAPIEDVAVADVAPRVELAGQVRVAELVGLAKETNQPWHVFSHDEPIDLRLAVDATGVAATADAPLTCAATVYAKCLGDGPEQKIGEVSAAIRPATQLTLDVAGQPLDPGMYRLTAMVEVTAPEAGAETPLSLRALQEGSLLQVY